MLNLLRNICVASLAVATVCTAALVEAKPISFEDACLLALNNSPQIRAQQYATEAAQAQVYEAKFYWTPKFEFSSKFGPQPKSSKITESENDVWNHFLDSWGFTTRNSLEFWIPLFTSMKVYNTHELAKIGLEVEKLREENESFSVRYDVARAYYGLQLAIASEDIVKEAEGYVEKIQREYTKLLDSGSEDVDPTDQYRIDIASANLSRLKDQAESSRLYAEKALSVHTRLELPIEIEEMDFSDNDRGLKSYEAILDLARANRVDLKLLDKANEAAHLQAKIQWLNWWPELVLGGEVYYKFSNAVPKFESDNFYIKDSYNGHGFGIGFIFRWNLDPVGQAFKVQQANAKADRMSAQRELAISGIELEINKTYYEVAAKYHNIQLTKKSRRAAKRLLTQKFMDYEAGTGGVDKMISALTTFIEQRAMYLNALNDYRVGLVKLQSVVGVSNIEELLAETVDDELE